jgi:peptide-methionine (S)-S-oxide reductase
VYDKPIVTEIKSAGDYWLANEEHQQYFSKKRMAKLKS